MATLHALCGLPGSGKSTFARELQRRNDAVVLTNDEWTATSRSTRRPLSPHS